MDKGCVAIESPGLEIAQLHQSFDQDRSASEDPLGLPWRSVEEFDSDALVNAVERVVIQPDGIEVVMKYQ